MLDVDIVVKMGMSYIVLMVVGYFVARLIDKVTKGALSKNT